MASNQCSLMLQSRPPRTKDGPKRLLPGRAPFQARLQIAETISQSNKRAGTLAIKIVSTLIWLRRTIARMVAICLLVLPLTSPRLLSRSRKIQRSGKVIMASNWSRCSRTKPTLLRTTTRASVSPRMVTCGQALQTLHPLRLLLRTVPSQARASHQSSPTTRPPSSTAPKKTEGPATTTMLSRRNTLTKPTLSAASSAPTRPPSVTTANRKT